MIRQLRFTITEVTDFLQNLDIVRGFIEKNQMPDSEVSWHEESDDDENYIVLNIDNGFKDDGHTHN